MGGMKGELHPLSSDDLCKRTELESAHGAERFSDEMDEQVEESGRSKDTRLYRGRDEE